MAAEATPARFSLGRYFRNRLVTGLLVLIPIGVTIVVLRFLFRTMAGVLGPALAPLIGRLPEAAVMAISVGAFLLLLYLAGVMTRNLAGRRLLTLGEAIVARVPLAKTIYAASKQVVDTFAVTDTKGFQSVVLVEFPRPGFYSVAFLTGRVRDAEGQEFCKLFIPTAPVPSAGFVQIVAPSEVHETDLTVEQAIRLLVSGGILSPPGWTVRRAALRPPGEQTA